MADVITRFKLETTQYDSKLRDAAKSLAEFTKHTELAGKDFEKFAEKGIESARALGNISTSATNVKDKVKELVSAYNDAARAFNSMTKEQQQGDYGKAFAESLQTLKGRIAEAKQELYGMKDTGGIFDSLKDKLTINVDALKLFQIGLQGAKGALEVAKDAFFQSESNIDEWGRTVEGAKGAYDVFLNTLNTGNWSNFFSNLSTAITGARDLYDALDRLGSIKSNNQAAIALVQAQIQELRVLKQQGKDVDEQIKEATQRLKTLQGQSVSAGKVAGRKEITTTLRNEVNARNTTGVNINDATLKAAADRLLKEGQTYFDGMARLVQKYENDARYQYTHIKYGTTPGEKPTVEKGFDLAKLDAESQKQYLIAKSITEGETRIQKGIGLFAQAVQEGAASTREEFKGNRYALQGSGSGSGSGGKWGTTTPKVDVQPIEGSVADLTKQMQDLQKAQQQVTNTQEWKQYQQHIDAITQRIDILKGKLDPENIKAGNPSQMGITMPVVVKDDTLQQQVQKIAESARTAMANTDIADPLLEKFRTTLVDSNTLGNLMKTAIDNGITGLAPDFTILKEQIAKGIDIDDSVWKDLVDIINEKLKEMKLDPIKLNFDTGAISGAKVLAEMGKINEDVWGNVASVIHSASSALGNFNEPALDIAVIAMNAIANVVSAFAKSLKGTVSPWDYIAGSIAGAAAMTTAVSGITSVLKKARNTGFSEGGIIKGDSYSGDNLYAGNGAMVNAGEIVLNRAQTLSLASQLENRSDMVSGESNVLISSENLRIVLHNGASARGMSVGEYLEL